MSDGGDVDGERGRREAWELYSGAEIRMPVATCCNVRRGRRGLEARVGSEPARLARPCGAWSAVWQWAGVAGTGGDVRLTGAGWGEGDRGEGGWEGASRVDGG